MSVNFRRRKVFVSKQSIKESGHLGVNAFYNRLHRLEHRADLLARVFEMEFGQVLKRRSVI